jgi:hypothetical protein
LQIGIGFVQNWAPILQGNFGIAAVQIEKILFHNYLYNLELSFQCHYNYLNPIFELKVMIKIPRHVQNPNLNPIRFLLQFDKFRFTPFHIFWVFPIFPLSLELFEKCFLFFHDVQKHRKHKKRIKWNKITKTKKLTNVN